MIYEVNRNVYALILLFMVGCAGPKNGDELVWFSYEHGRQEIHGSAITRKGEIFTAGSNSIFVRVGGEKRQIFGKGVALEKIWADPGDVVWATADYKNAKDEQFGAILKCNNKACEVATQVSDMDYYGIGGDDSGMLYASGIHVVDKKPWGVVSSFDGKESHILYEKEGYWFVDLWANPQNKVVVAVGQSLGGEVTRGVIAMRNSSGEWIDITPRADDYIYLSVWGNIEGSIYVVGQVAQESKWESGELDASKVIKWENGEWIDVYGFKTEFLFAIRGKGSNCLLVGGHRRNTRQNGGGVSATVLYRLTSDRIVEEEMPPILSPSYVSDISFDSQTESAFVFTINGDIYQSSAIK